MVVTTERRYGLAMNRTLSLTWVLALAAAATAASGGVQPQLILSEGSLTSRVLSTYAPRAAEGEAADARVAAARALLAALPEARRQDLVFALDDPERARWTNLPPGTDEPGLRLGDCDQVALERVCDLLATVMSPVGYARTRDILLGDDRLLRGGRARPGFGAENFWLLLFGEPSADGPWGLQLDGHHLGLNLSFQGDEATMSPTFLGAQPARFERGDETVEPLAGIEGAARALMASLTEDLRKIAIVGERRGGNVAAAGRDGFVPQLEGLPCSELDEAQIRHATALFTSVLEDLTPAVTRKRLEALVAELPQMRFSWRGPSAPESDVSFRLQGPSLLLEFACQDIGGKPLDHLHVMYRDPTNEYGAKFGK